MERGRHSGACVCTRYASVFAYKFDNLVIIISLFGEIYHVRLYANIVKITRKYIYQYTHSRVCISKNKYKCCHINMYNI